MIRHGQSTWNAAGRWQGQADPPLTAAGETQALTAAAALRDVAPFAAIVTSDLQRAAITASIIADELTHPKVALDKRLRERHAGEWQGLTRAEVEERFPGYLAEGRRPPRFEAAEVAAARAAECLLALARELDGGAALAVSHGGIIRALRHLVGLTDDLAFPNLGGQWFEFADDALVAGGVVSLVDGEAPVQSAPL